jgi:putative membrane protein
MKNFWIALVSCVLIVACNNKSESENTVSTDSLTGNNDNAENSTTGTNGDMNDMDREFIMKAGMGNTAEIETGTLAQQKGSTAAVRDYGSLMVRDHGDAQAQLKAAAGSMVTVPDSVDQEHAAMRSKLEGMSGLDFGQEYMRGQVKDHEATIALFERQIAGGSNTALMDFARTTLPHLKMHLEKAQSLVNNNTNK